MLCPRPGKNHHTTFQRRLPISQQPGRDQQKKINAEAPAEEKVADLGSISSSLGALSGLNDTLEETSLCWHYIGALCCLLTWKQNTL